MKQINPHLLDVVKRDGGFSLFYSGKPLVTPAGSDVAHHEPRLLEHMLRELSLSRTLDPGGLDSYALFEAKDHLPAAVNFPAAIGRILVADPLVRRRSGPASDSSECPGVIPSMLDDDDCMAFYFSGLAGVLGCLDEFLVERGSPGLGMIESSFDDFAGIIVSSADGLSVEKKAALLSLCSAHGGGVILPLLLILKILTASEYANALFSIHLPFRACGGVRKGLGEIAVEGISKRPVIPDWHSPELNFSILRSQASAVMEYLSCCERSVERGWGLRKLIAMGEHFGLEFKSCLRWNLKSCQKDPAIEHANLKTVAAFLNSRGGTLLVGVRDDGSIEGIETDAFTDEDRFSLHFWNLVKARLGQDATPFISASFEKMDGKTVFVVECARSPFPVFLNQKQGEDEFYVRVGPSASRLTIREALKYIENRFEKNDGPGRRENGEKRGGG